MTIDIFYHQYAGTGEFTQILNSPLSVDGVGIEPVRSIDNYKPNSVPHYACPAWRHKQEREFIVYAPKDITVEQNGYQFKCPTIDDDELANWLIHIEDPKTIQIACPMVLCWTKAKRVWVEVEDHPMTALNNNFTVVSGWFNLSEWTRPIAFAVMRVDSKKPVIIKRGDPLYKIRFYQENNLKQKFNMIKSEPSEKMLRDINNRLSVKHFIPFLAKDLMFGKERKCPFGFGK